MMLPKPPTPEQFKDARVRSGLSQSDAARLLGFGSRTRISEIENGSQKLSAVKWCLFLLATGMHPSHELKEKA